MNSNKSLPPLLDPAAAPEPPPRRLNWLLFALALFMPTVLTILITMTGGQKSDAAVAVALIGGGLSGIICGGMLGWRFGKSTTNQIVLGIVLGGVFVVACIGMNCLGCLAGGFKLDFR